jgi:hypothetical protein
MQVALTIIEWILWTVALYYALLPFGEYLFRKYDQRGDKWPTPIIDSKFLTFLILPVILVPALAITMYAGYSKLHFLWLVPLTLILYNYLDSEIDRKDQFALQLKRAIFAIPPALIGVLREYWSRPKRTNWYCKACHRRMKREYWVRGNPLFGIPSGYQHDDKCPHCGLILKRRLA